MREVKIEKLTMESFSEYGYFANMINPDKVHFGQPPIEFYRDILQLNLGGSSTASFSICRVEKRPEIIEVAEFHSSAGEGILPLDSNILIHVAHATQKDNIPLDEFRVFSVPKGTLVALKPGVWHHAPFVDGSDFANVVIVLPERTYANDCEVAVLSEEDKIKIIR